LSLIEIQYEQPNGRQQVGVLSLGIDLGDKSLQSDIACDGNFKARSRTHSQGRRDGKRTSGDPSRLDRHTGGAAREAIGISQLRGADGCAPGCGLAGGEKFETIPAKEAVPMTDFFSAERKLTEV
jgi:hypothetical protein